MPPHNPAGVGRCEEHFGQGWGGVTRHSGRCYPHVWSPLQDTSSHCSPALRPGDSSETVPAPPPALALRSPAAVQWSCALLNFASGPGPRTLCAAEVSVPVPRGREMRFAAGEPSSDLWLAAKRTDDCGRAGGRGPQVSRC